MIPIAIVVIFIAIIVWSGATVVRQQTAGIVERLGKYRKTLQPGFHVIIPIIDHVAAKIPLRVIQDEIVVETKTKDNVFCQLSVAVQYRVDPNQIERSYYELQSPSAQIKSYIQDAIRSAVPKLTLDDAFERKDDIAREVQETVSAGMSSYGFIVVSTLMTEITPDKAVKDSMNSINAAQRQRVAAQELAEADKIKLVTNAQAKAEAARLDGKGIADQRREIANGLSEQMKTLKSQGINNDQVMQLIMVTQYMNALESIGTSEGNSTIFLQGGADGASNVQQQMISSIRAGMSTSASNRSNPFEYGPIDDGPSKDEYKK